MGIATAVIITLCISAPTSFFLGFMLSEKAVDNGLLRDENRDLSNANTFLNNKNSALKKENDIIAADRDRYAEVASSHEVTYKHDTEFIKVANFEYDSTMAKNLKRIKEYLARFDKGSIIKFDFKVWIVGGWKIHLQEGKHGWKWSGKNKDGEDNNEPYIEVGTRINNKLVGHPDEVYDELETILKDPYRELFVGGQWAVPNGAINIRGSVYELVENGPKVKTVEVLHIQKEIEIIEVEKPIIINETPETSMPSNLDELIAAKVEVELEARRGKKLDLHNRKIASEVSRTQ